MYLIKINNDKSLDIYTLNPDENKIMEYKRRIIEEQSITFATLRTNDKKALDTFLNSQTINMRDISFSRKLSQANLIFSSYSETTIPFYQLSELEEKVVEAYLNNYYQHIKPQIIIPNDEPNKYLLTTTDKISYLTSRFGTSYLTGQNLILPRELYFLQLIESGGIKTKDVYSFIRAHEKLFHLTHFKTIPDFEELLNCGIIDIETYNAIFQRSESETKLIRTLKKGH